MENLLSLSRIDNEKLTVKKKPEALEEIVPQAVRTVSGKLGGRTVHYDMPEELLLVPMDATLIMQVLCNILDNAAKHTAEDGNIWIKVWNTGKNAVFRISNDGSPMRKEDLRISSKCIIPRARRTATASAWGWPSASSS